MKFNNWKLWTAIAACLALIIGILVIGNPFKPEHPDITAPAVQQANSNTIPPTSPSGMATQLLLSTDDADSRCPMRGCIGRYDVVEAPVDYIYEGMVVTARATQVLEDTYFFYDDHLKTPYRLVKMETLKVLHGEEMVSSFYYLQKQSDSMDLMSCEALVMDFLHPYGYEGSVLYNATAGAPERMQLMLFGSVYQDSVFGYKSGSSTSLEELEAEVISNKHFELTNVPSVQSIEDITSQKAKDALEYVQNTDNGLFIPTASNRVLYYSPSIQYQARRYIYGYPTTETVRILIDKAEYSESKFTKEELAELVDLEPAITAVKEAFGDGNIHPPHIADAQSVELKEHFIFGWYCKGKDGVYGIIRLTFRYVGGYDDAYFIVTGDSKEPQQINRNSLLELVGTADDYIYLGDYNSDGMTQLGHYG